MTAKDLFNKSATVEYRAVPTLDGSAQWHWVLFSALGKVLGGNTATTRGKAAVQARNKARQLRHRITKVSISGLVEEGRMVDVKQFIASVSGWMDVATKLGYKPTQDSFWAKAAEREPIYAKTIESHDYKYTISTFGGLGTAKSGGQLVWVAIDFQDIHNRNRIALHTFLTTDKRLIDVLMMVQQMVETYGESWDEVDRYLNDFARKAPAIIESEQGPDSPQRPPANPAKDYIMGTPTWQEQLLQMTHGWGPRQHSTNDPDMLDTAVWEMKWAWDTAYIDMTVLVYFTEGSKQVPRMTMFRGEYMGREGGSLDTKWLGNEQLDVEGDADMAAFVDKLRPVWQQIETWHKQKQPPSYWDFAKMVSRVHTWMANQPQMADYI